MGSVSSLISGHNLHSKHCKASEHKLRKGLHSKKAGRSLDGLLKYGFSQDHCSTNNNSKASYHSGKNDDFFYIKVSNKPRAGVRNINTAEESQETSAEVDRNGGPPELVPVSGKLQVSQRALRSQQLLQLQVTQLQQDKERLQEEVDQLNHDRVKAESHLRAYETQKKHLAPTCTRDTDDAHQD